MCSVWVQRHCCSELVTHVRGDVTHRVVLLVQLAFDRLFEGLQHVIFDRVPVVIDLPSARGGSHGL